MLWFSYYFVIPPESRNARIHGIGILTRKIYKMTQFKKKITGTKTMYTKGHASNSLKSIKVFEFVYFLLVLYCVDVLQESVVEMTLLRCDFGRTSQLFPWYSYI